TLNAVAPVPCRKELKSKITAWHRQEAQLAYSKPTHGVVNDDKKFAVALDVSQFKPQKIIVCIDGRDVIIAGHQKLKADHGFKERSFVRRWALPEDVDLNAGRTQPLDGVILEIEAPKTGELTNRRVLLL
ncbi:Hsp20/alpha crystallin family protein, partial [Ostertagia ostertagi]